MIQAPATHSRLFRRPRFDRGTGLGNRLFDWANCAPFARDHGAIMPRSSAISDLLELSTCRFRVGSGGSSFSAWTAFLGQRPVVKHTGKSFAWFGLGKAVPYVGTCPGNDDSDLSHALRSLP